MTKQDFLKQIWLFFKQYGFVKHGNHFYLDCENDIVCVAGFYQSNYGNYKYMEYGFAIKSINPRMPYPKFSELNINCGRILVNGKESIYYEKLLPEEIANSLHHEIQTFIMAGKQGKAGIQTLYLPKCTYMIGAATANYFGISASSGFTIYPDSLWNI